jgi:hypothetical protein
MIYHTGEFLAKGRANLGWREKLAERGEELQGDRRLIMGAEVALVSGVCRFCGCTEEMPCLLGMMKGPAGVEPIYCVWLDDDEEVCTNPACVEKAYRKAVAEVAQGRAWPAGRVLE